MKKIIVLIMSILLEKLKSRPTCSLLLAPGVVASKNLYLK